MREFRLPRPLAQYDARDEAETRRLIELALLRDTGGGAGLESRRDVAFTTASLANGASQQSSTDFGAPGQLLLMISVNRACRLRFYAIASVQSTDASRAYTTPPQAGIGMLLDAVWLTVHTKYIAPPVLLFNGNVPASNTIYWTVENLSGSTGTVTVTATVVSIEAP